MSALYTQDVRGAEMILRQMQSSNALIRWTAVKLAAEYQDSFLIEALKNLLVAEKVGFVRLEVIWTLGLIGVKEIKECLNSNRSELRHLACQTIAHLNVTEKEEVLEPLLQDSSSEVRIAALNA